MIQVTIEGKTKELDSGIIVRDILDEFDPRYAQFICAVKANGKIIGLDDAVSDDCVIIPLTFRELMKEKSADDLGSEGTDSQSEEEFLVDEADIEELTMSELNRLLSVENTEDSDDEESVIEDSDDEESVIEGSDDEESGIEDSDDEESVIEGSDDEESGIEDSDDEETGIDDSDDEESETEDADGLGEEDEPESDGEFISVKRFGIEELTLDLMANVPDDNASDDNPAEKADAQAEDNGNMDQDSEQQPEGSEDDYTVDDVDMEAFLASQILPEGVGVSSLDEDNSEEFDPHNDLIVLDESGKAWYDVDDDSIDDFVDYGKNAEVPNVSEEPDDSEKRKKNGIPLYLKAAAALVLLVGLGWGVGRVAIQVTGSPGDENGNGKKSHISASDVSDSDDISSDTSDTKATKVTSTTKNTTTTTTTVATTTEKTKATTVSSTAEKTTTRAKKTTTTARKNNKTTTTTTRRTTKTNKSNKTTTKKTTKKTDDETTTGNTGNTTSSSQGDNSTTVSDKTTTTSQKPASDKTTTTSKKPASDKTTTAPGKTQPSSKTTGTTSSTNPSVLGDDEPYDPNDVVG